MTKKITPTIHIAYVRYDTFTSAMAAKEEEITDLRRQLQDARDKALEEAAELAMPSKIASDDDYSVGWTNGRRSASNAIRALKGN